ncbi:MAG: 30S ribosomal protein S3 [Clostridia bacterium]|nr:30S ribosomal protein S3 [Clostridia bacterium]
MGQKVNPNGLRVGINKDWEAKWYAGKKNFSDYLVEDVQIRNYIKNIYKPAPLAKDAPATEGAEGEIRPVRKLDDRPRISKIVVERCDQYIKVKVYTGRPGLLIGKEGSGVEQLSKAVKKICAQNGHTYKNYLIEFVAVKVVDIDAQLVAEEIANQLEKRVSFRRAMKMAMKRARQAGAKGIKTMVSGRLDGAEIARSEQYHDGSIPLQTLRADIDYGFAEAATTYGRIGVKTWIYHGEVFGKKVEKKGGEA